jgi:hypothetical protein
MNTPRVDTVIGVRWFVPYKQDPPVRPGELAGADAQ